MIGPSTINKISDEPAHGIQAVSPWDEQNRRRRGVSVVIPVLNEAEQLMRNLPAVLIGQPSEVIVVDGGSTDRSREVARSFGATVLRAESGRGRQLNAGARAARASMLLFLHADTKPPVGYVQEIFQILSQPNVGIGAFRFAVDAPGLRYRALEACVRLRGQLLRLPYGDQGLFMRRDFWARRGGFPASAMEDLKLVWASRPLARVVLSRKPAVTSARRWIQEGLLRVSATNLCALARFLLARRRTTAAQSDMRNRGCRVDGVLSSPPARQREQASWEKP